LLLAANFAARLLSLYRSVDSAKAGNYQQRYRKDPHDKVSPWFETENA
jgi:hypothetical protein